MTEEERAAALRAMVRDINGGARPEEPQAATPENPPQAPPRSAENTQYKSRPPAGIAPELYNAYLQTLRGLTPNRFL